MTKMTNMRIYAIIAGILCLTAVAAASVSAAAVSIRTAPDGKTTPLRSFVRDGMVYLSLTDVARAAGFGHTHDAFLNRHTFTNERGKLTFVRDNNFYTIDTTAALLPFPPIRLDSALFLPAPYVAAAFSAKYPGKLVWNERGAVVTIEPAARDTATAGGGQSPPAAAPPAAGEIIRTVVIDPGHGGRDPGAIGPGGTYEKDVVLAISLELRDLLVKAGLTVYMTRDTDVFIPLVQRTRFANDKKADLFVSVHANAIDGTQKRRDTVRGYKIYFLSQAKNESDKLSAMRENAAIQFEDIDTRKNYDALQNVLISILGSEYLRESQELSIIMEQTFAAAKTKISRQQRGIGQANFWVLNGAYMPAVLIEVGFISNTAEEKLLTDKNVQKLKAAAIAEAIVKFKNQLEAGQ